MNLPTLRTKITESGAQRSNLLKATDRRESEIAAAKEAVETMEQAQALVQKVATETQEQLRFHLEDVVQHALESLLPGKYAFRVDFEVQRGKTAASMYLEADGQPMDPMDECGGTVVQVVAFALRVAAWTLARTDNTILLDEPFTAVSADLRPVCGELLQGLSRKLGIQFIVVATHESDRRSFLLDYADQEIHVTQGADGRSRVSIREGAGAG